MSADFDDPATEEQWCSERQVEVAAYLEREGVKHGRIGEWPAWHVAPHVSVWAIESDIRPGWVGWWVICGDLPTDYVSAEKIKHPRNAIHTIAQRWLEASEFIERGEQHPSVSIEALDTDKELVPMLKSRAMTLIDWANDDAFWAEDTPT